MLFPGVFPLAVVMCSVRPPVVVAQSCTDACKVCSGPKKDPCLECESGWILHDNTCVDVDECDVGPARCPPNTYCFNTDGFYECKGCARPCVGCVGPGPARCRSCALGYTMTGAKCLDIDECGERVLACPGLNEFCVNEDGSFRCQCAEGFRRKDDVCVREQTSGPRERGLFEDLQDDEVVVLQQMALGVLLCALATLAAKGDMVFTSVFMGALAAVAGYWLSDHGDRLLNGFLKGR